MRETLGFLPEEVTEGRIKMCSEGLFDLYF